MLHKKHVSLKCRKADHGPSNQQKKETTYTFEPLESRLLLSADIAGAAQALPQAPTAGQGLSVAQMLAQPITFFHSTVTPSAPEAPSQNQPAPQTVTSPPQNQTPTPTSTSDSNVVSRTQESDQVAGQQAANQIVSPTNISSITPVNSTTSPANTASTTPANAAPITATSTAPTLMPSIDGQQGLSVAQILAQPISLSPAVVTTNTSNVTEVTTNTSISSTPTPISPATTNLTPSGSVASAQPNLTNSTTSVSTPIDPALLSQWRQQMINFGQHHANSLNSLSGEAALEATYYDAARVFYQIADYTHDPSWLAPAHQATTIYRDQFVLPNNGAVRGYWNFTEGLLQDYQHTGDVRSKDAIILLSKNADFAVDGTPLAWTASTVQSREVAYSITSYLNAESVGQPHRARLNDLVNQALGHLDQWFVSKTAPYLQPFMAGLTMEALIQYNTAVGGDPRILPAIQSAVDSMWSHNWLPGSQSFQYVDRVLSGVGGPDPSPDLNMLIAPAYAWMYHQTHNPIYQQEADAIFRGGVTGAYLQGAKQYNQNYEFAFDFLNWRNS